METSKTEALVKINALKDKHEKLKKEIMDLAVEIKVKENELLEIEEQYTKYLEVLIAE